MSKAHRLEFHQTLPEDSCSIEMKREKKEMSSFADLYPSIAWFIENQGYITLGSDDEGFSPAFAQALDMGGTVWEGEQVYKSIDDALRAMEKGLNKWMKEQGLGQEEVSLYES